MKKEKTIGEHLYWSYANLAMAHAAVEERAKKYKQIHYMIRASFYSGLKTGKIKIRSLADDDRLKMILPQACCYCASPKHLVADHLIPKKRGGRHAGENLVWACRTCNSSKGAKDVLEWLWEHDDFPSILLLRRYLKLAVLIAEEKEVLEIPLDQAPELPFAIEYVPQVFPPPSQLRLWITEL